MIATIPGRESMLARALESARSQTIPVRIEVELDTDGAGPSVTRNRAVDRADTEWVTFLDDDDLLYPDHVESLLNAAVSAGTDAAYSGYDLMVLAGRRFRVTNKHVNDYARPMPVAFLVRRMAFLAAGGFGEEKPEEHHLQEALRAAGVVFAFHPGRTWQYRVHGKNTSGLPQKASRIYREVAS